MKDLSSIEKKVQRELKNTASVNDLEKIQLAYLGRNGIINSLLREIKNIRPEERKQYGQKINELKNLITQSIETKRKELILSTDKQAIDVTLPGKPYPHGTLHPITYAIEEISRIFEKIGFVRMSYPEVEWEYYSFEALNMPKGHPARDDFETFYIDVPEHAKLAKMVLTPHTSSGQVREMLRLGGKPPIRMINIAKCYRRNWDATHAPMFYQFEGMVVDRGINITHLKGTIDYFAKNFFGPDREIRLRPHHFQFTEPSFETDISCNVCGGTGTVNGKKCRVCKSGWLELGGSGMVHPNVLRAGGIDPEVYTGWAFGFGPERCLMMKLGLSEIRDLYSGDIRFLKQF